MRRDPLKSDVLSRMRTYDSPLKDVDPLTASHAALRRNGLPNRPNPRTRPSLARLWNEVFARPTTFVKAELAIDPIMSGRDPLPAANTEFGPGDWAGVAVQTATLGFGEPAKWVFAEWVVPEVSAVDPAGYDQIAVGFWVGLDGLASLGQQVLQAGIAAYVDPGLWSTDVNWYAWIEWYTDIHNDPAVNVANFPVTPGDTVSFLVCAPQPDLGHITMLNRTRGHLTSVDINAPAGTTSLGASAEWIVEQVTPVLPNFRKVTFTSCVAGTENHLFDLTAGGAMDITGPGSGPYGSPITRTFVAFPNLFLVEWKGWGIPPF